MNNYKLYPHEILSRFTPEQWKKLKRIAKAKKVSIAELIRRLVDKL